MNANTLPVVILQSLPDCCVLCSGDLRMLLIPTQPGMTSRPVRCPHCSGAADLLDAIGEGAR